ncbi:hypothetical protein RJ641_014358 [Dillenia turbinata]|uniref:TRP C-terminal domain-containing protein n=1 Tax=Dillenia turbinata TaxID=194707 RepID=A0AAN8URL2_9MAGN
MAFSKLLFLAWVYWFLSLLCFGVHSGGSEVSVNFLEAPLAVTNITSATFLFEVSINGNDGTCGTCYSCVICKLDNQISEDCADKNVSFNGLLDGKHKFEVCAAANQSQEAVCSSYHWTVGKEIIFHGLLKGLPNGNFFHVFCTLVEHDDTVQPTAYLTASTLVTNAQNISVNISFSEPCTRDGGDSGFKCSAPDACNLLVHGAGQVLPSTLRVLQPNLQFSLMVELSSSVQYGEVQLVMGENFCKDIAGNKFARTSNSSLSIQISESFEFIAHVAFVDMFLNSRILRSKVFSLVFAKFSTNFVSIMHAVLVIVYPDRRERAENLTTSSPAKLFQINGQSRTVVATNKYDDLKVWLYFSEPVLNSSEQILHTLSTSEGQLLPTNEDTLGDRRFIYQIQNLSPMSIVTVTMNPNSIVSRQGTAVPPVEPMTIFYDIQRPAVSLYSSTLRTRDSRIPIRIEFSKTVFGFNSSHVSIEGGQVIPDRQILSFTDHPPYVALSSFHPKTWSIYEMDILVDKNVQILKISINENVTSDIAGNENLASKMLQVGHYNSVPKESIAASSATTSTFGLTTLVSGVLTLTIATLQANPALSPQSATLMPDPSQNLFRTLGHIQVFALSRWIAVDLPLEYYEFVRGLEWSIPYLKLPWEKNGHVSTPSAPSNHLEDTRDSFSPVFSSPLTPIFRSSTSRFMPAAQEKINGGSNVCSSSSDLISFQYEGQKPKNSPGEAEKSRGWKVFEKLMFWTGVLDLSIIVVHVFIFYMLRFKKSPDPGGNFGSLAFPRIEILLIVLELSAVSMASASLIHGRTTCGIIVGVLIWGVLSFILLASFLFLFIGITCGKLIEYEENPRQEDMGTIPCLQRFRQAISRLQRYRPAMVGPAKQGNWTANNQLEVKFGPLFEDLRGPSKMSNETQSDPFIRKFLAGPGIYYTILLFVSKVTQGILNGVFPDDPSTKAPAIILLSLSSLQLFFLVLTKPFILRRLQFVETVAVAAEVVMFAITVFSKQEPYEHGKKAVGITLLALFLVSYLVQTINLWYGMYEQIKRLDPPRGSFVIGLRTGFDIFLYFFTDSDRENPYAVSLDKGQGGSSTSDVQNTVPIDSQNAAGTEDPEAKQSGALVRQSSRKEGTASASASLPSSSDNKLRPAELNKKLPPFSRPRQFLRGLCPGVLSHTSNQVTEEETCEEVNATDQVTEEEKKEKTSGIDQATEEEPKEESQSADRVTEEEKEGNSGIEQVSEEEPKMESHRSDEITEEDKREKTSGIDKVSEEEPQEDHSTDGVTRGQSSSVERDADKEKREETHTTDQVDEENKI